MAQVIWTPAALGDVARLHAFLAPKSRAAAQRAIRSIRAGTKSLEAHPEVSRLVSKMPPEFRERYVPFGRHAREAGY